MSKKSYFKPAVTFYTLEASTDVGGACEFQATQAEYVCPVTVEGYPFTIINRDACEAYGPDFDDFICYHVPLGDNSMFGS
mgnify:CR=1 FL=1